MDRATANSVTYRCAAPGCEAKETVSFASTAYPERPRGWRPAWADYAGDEKVRENSFTVIYLCPSHA